MESGFMNLHVLGFEIMVNCKSWGRDGEKWKTIVALFSAIEVQLAEIDQKGKFAKSSEACLFIPGPNFKMLESTTENIGYEAHLDINWIVIWI